MNCVKCVMCLDRADVGGEWIRGLALGFTNHVGTGGLLDVCLCLYCGGVDGIIGECEGGLDQDLKGWRGVMSV